ncbi:hypothetical protein [Kribbella sp. NPDC055071]
MADADDSVNDVIQQTLAGLRRIFRPARALLSRSRLLRWLTRLTQSQRHRVGTETVRDNGAWSPNYDTERQLNGAQARWLNAHRDLQAQEANLRDLRAEVADLGQQAAQRDRDLHEARGNDNDPLRDPNSDRPFVVEGEVVDSHDTPLTAEQAARDADRAAADRDQAAQDADQAKRDRDDAQETADQSPGAAGTVAEVAAAEAVVVEADELRDRAEEQAETDSDELAEADQKEDFEQGAELNENGVIEPVGPEAPRDPELDSAADEVDSPTAEADEVGTSADEVDAPGLDANELDSLAADADELDAPGAEADEVGAPGAEADGIDADRLDADGIDRPAGEVDAQGQDFQQQSELNENGVIEPVGPEAPRDPEVDSPAVEADGVDTPAAQANGVNAPAAQADAQDQDFQQQAALNEDGVIEPVGAEAPRVDEPDQQQETGESGPALPTATDERDRSERNEQNAQQAGQSGPAVDPPVEDYAIADQKAAMSNNPGAQQNRTGGPKEMSDGDRNHLRHQVDAGIERPGAPAPAAAPATSQESNGNGERSFNDRQLANQGSGRSGPSQGSSGPPARGE